MKRLLIPGLIGLLAGVGGGTGIAIVRRPAPATAPADTVHADSTTIIEASHALPAPAVARSDSTAADSAAAPIQEPAVVAAPASAPSQPLRASPVETTSVVFDSTQRTQVRRIGRIFAAMSPRDAAKVLQELDDADVMVIVGALTEKQAAAILQSFAPERAAVISRGSLRAALGARP